MERMLWVCIFLFFRQEEYKRLHWDQYNEVYLQLEEENRVEDAVPELRDKKLNDMRRKWGMNYDEEQLEYLENLPFRTFTLSKEYCRRPQ